MTLPRNITSTMPGAQVDKLADSAYLRYREACGETIGEIPEGLYPGDYLIPVGQALQKKYGTCAAGPAARGMAADTCAISRWTAMMELIKSDLAAIGIHHDVFTSERAMTAMRAKWMKPSRMLDEKGLIYNGVLEPPKGKAARRLGTAPANAFSLHAIRR